MSATCEHGIPRGAYQGTAEQLLDTDPSPSRVQIDDAADALRAFPFCVPDSAREDVAELLAMFVGRGRVAQAWLDGGEGAAMVILGVLLVLAVVFLAVWAFALRAAGDELDESVWADMPEKEREGGFRLIATEEIRARWRRTRSPWRVALAAVKIAERRARRW